MNKFLTYIFVVGVLMIVSTGYVFASITDGSIDSVYKYAWSNNTGWINFGCQECNVHIMDSAITGYAWSENYGWINLNPSGSGVKNNNEGTLSGSAWGQNIGWINFSGVTINNQGKFTGAATGDVVGIVNFNCDNCQVWTDWRPLSVRTSGQELPPGGIYNAPIAPTPSPAPTPPFSILINDGATLTNSQIITLKFVAGADTKRIAISDDSNFTNAVQEDYQPTKIWDLCKNQESLCQNPVDGIPFQVFARFYTQQGQQSVETVSASIVLDNKAPTVEITNIKSSYSPEEDIILSGKTEPNAEIFLYWNSKYGLGHSDNQGQWIINLGKMPAGNYQLTLLAHDLAGNSGESTTAELVIKAGAISQAPIPIIEQLQQVLLPLIPKIFRPKTTIPEQIVVVPKIAPVALQLKWKVFASKPIALFVFAPLPKEVIALANKFPQLEKTFEQVGISKMTDIEKLKAAQITLPGLTETLSPLIVGIEPQKFALPQGIPIAKLTKQLKEKIPNEIVFAKTAGELIDFNIKLSITEKGQPQQEISTIVGEPLQLAVKPEKPVKSVKGYVIFKSKRPKPVSSQLPLGSMTASLMFANPGLAQSQEKPIKQEIEQALVLLEFEYTDPDNDGIYTAEINSPMVDGEYEIITVMDYEDVSLGNKEIRLVTVVDPEGYVFEKDGDKETRVNGSIVSLFWLNPETKQYELWLAKDYQQENPQTTDVRGTYSFLVPEGYYYLTVNAPGYLSYDGKPFQVKEGSGVHVNIELKTKYWWLKIVDWKTVLLIIVVILLFFNFYRDKARERLVKSASNKS